MYKNFELPSCVNDEMVMRIVHSKPGKLLHLLAHSQQPILNKSNPITKIILNIWNTTTNTLHFDEDCVTILDRISWREIRTKSHLRFPWNGLDLFSSEIPFPVDKEFVVGWLFHGIELMSQLLFSDGWNVMHFPRSSIQKKDFVGKMNERNAHLQRSD